LGMSNMAGYEERYCAYVDVLGFRELIAALGDGSIQFEAIRDLLQRVHKPHDEQFVGYGDTDFRAQSISDAVALSTKKNDVGLAVLCATLRDLSLALLYQGYFTRGVLCSGLLYHDDKMVFGEAFVKAYTLETGVVRYPRIMLTKDVAEAALNSTYDDTFPEHIKQAEDGPYFLHILWRLRMKLDLIKTWGIENPQPEPDLSYFSTIQRMIQTRFNESVDTPKHFEKVQWFARYWNDSIIQIRSQIGRINGPGLDQKPAVWG